MQRSEHETKPSAIDADLSNFSAANRDRALVVIVCVLLAALVWIVFGQTIHHEFLNYDDNEYVYDNPHVKHGLTLSAIGWTFTHAYAANWHPLTTISHMLDCQIYGLQPWGHHLTNVLLHAAAAILLFLALRKLTFSIWPSAFVAALFAIHPLRVESVAWVSERKDVLSGVFFMLTLLAYARHARAEHRSVGKYAAVVILFALGLLCKPTLVTLPFVLLLLDYWPLGRFSKESVRLLLWEKIPLVILSVLSCLATIDAQSEALEATRKLAFFERASNALLSYAIYLGQMVYPARLAVFYPYRTDIAVVSQLVPAGLLLVLISAFAIYWRWRYPFLLIGWLWYLGMLVPMIGLMQVGSQAHADRYTYLTQIGLYIAATWAALELLGKWQQGRKVLAVAALLLVTVLTARSYQETEYWQNTETLWRHALRDTSNNYVAHNNLGHVLTQHKQFAEAIAHFRQAIQLKADYAEAYNNLGNGLLDSDESARSQKPPDLEHPDDNSQQNKVLGEAIENYKKALEAKPDFPEAWTNLATAFLEEGKVDDAIDDYRRALEIDPDLPEANGNFGNALLQKGRIEDAIIYYDKAIREKPDYADAHYGISKALLMDGKSIEAMNHLQTVLSIRPDYPEAHHNMAVILAQNGQLDPAIAQYRKAIELRPNYAQAENNLGNALLRKGQVDEAIVHLANALKIDPNYAEACNDMGSAYMQKGQIESAINYYEQAIRIRQDYAEAHSNLGNAFLQKKEVDKAIAQDKAAVFLRPQSAPMQYNLGNALVKKGNLAEGITAYQAALQAQPNYVEVLNQLGVTLATSGKANEALEEFKKALQINANYAEAHYNLGHLLAKLGRRDEAIAQLTEALRLRPTYADAKQQLRDLGVPVSE